MTTERAINQTSQTGRTATHDAPRSFLSIIMISNAEIQLNKSHAVGEPYKSGPPCVM